MILCQAGAGLDHARGGGLGGVGERGQVAHLAAGPGVVLAVQVQLHVRQRERLGPARRGRRPQLAHQVGHRGRAQQVGRAERQATHRAQLWRIKDNEVAIDAVGELYDGTKMDGPAGLRNALLKHKDAFLQSFTESLMTYALGRRVEFYDMPGIRQIVRDAAKTDYRMSSFLLNVIKSAAFQMTAADMPETTTNVER